MKRLSLCAAVVFSVAACTNKGGAPAPGAPSANAPLETEDQKTLYALGLALARNTQVFGLTPADGAYVIEGFNDAISGAKPQVDLETYGPKIQQFAQSRMKAKSEAEKAKGAATLDAAAAEPGAEKLPSGIVFKSITPGTGASPTASDTVQVNYEGKLADGTVFDSSYKRNAPATFPLHGVVPCWTEGLQHMKVGGKAQLTCPSSLAYGDSGHPPTIPGGATLIFTVELLQIMPATPGMPGQAVPGLPAPSTGGSMGGPMGGFRPNPGMHMNPGMPSGHVPPPPPPGTHPGMPPPANGAKPPPPAPVHH